MKEKMYRLHTPCSPPLKLPPPLQHSLNQHLCPQGIKGQLSGKMNPLRSSQQSLLVAAWIRHLGVTPRIPSKATQATIMAGYELTAKHECSCTLQLATLCVIFLYPHAFTALHPQCTDGIVKSLQQVNEDTPVHCQWSSQSVLVILPQTTTQSNHPVCLLHCICSVA